jgi:hypothetical protein
MLLFKKKFMAAIRSGEKTQTLRLWPCRRMKPGQRSYIPGVGYITVDAVDETTLDALTDQDARLNGFPTAAALRAEFESLYRDKAGGAHQVYRVRFHVLGPVEQAACRAEKEQRKRAAKTS